MIDNASADEQSLPNFFQVLCQYAQNSLQEMRSVPPASLLATDYVR